MHPGRPTTFAAIALLAAVMISTTGRAQEKEGVVVMPLKSKVLKESALNALNNLIVMAVTELSPYDVATYADVEAQLDLDQRKQLLNCSATECAVDLAGPLGKRFLLAGEVNRLGKRSVKVIITLNLVDTRDQRAVRAQAKGNDDEDLYEQLVEIAVRDLLKNAGIQPRAGPGAGAMAETAIGEQPTEWDAGGGELVLVRFESTPEGAVVMANGQLVCSSPPTPCQKTLAAGSYQVQMQKERYEPAQQRVTVVKGMAPVAMTLAPSFGLLSVTSEPSGLSVKVDGKVVGTTPLSRHEVSAGGHEVLVTDQRYYDSGQRLAVKKGEHRELAVKLTPKEGLLEVTAQDAKGNDVAADVVLGGATLGKTPLSQRVVVGRYEVEVSHSKHGAFKETVTIEERKKTSVRAKLEGGSSGEWVFSRPAGVQLNRTEVTVAQYGACVKAGRCTAPDTGTYCNWGNSDRGNHPVNCIDWNQATAYCAWAGGRLPTEDEWFAEASNKGSREYPWGNQEVTCDYVIWGDGKNTDGCGKDSTWPVCSKPKGNSVSGLCDVSGNVWEWTSTAEGSNRVLRGGSWFGDSPGYLRATSRSWRAPSYRDGRYGRLGFRCARPSH